MVGLHSISDRRRALNPGGILVAVGGPMKGLWIEPITSTLKLVLVSLGRDRKLVPMLTSARTEDLATLSGLLETGKIVPVIDRTYPLSEVPDAIAYVMKGHARGKVVIGV